MSQAEKQGHKSDRGQLVTRTLLAIVGTLLVLCYVAFEGYFYKWPVHPQNQPVVIWLLLCGPILCQVLRSLEHVRRFDPELADGARKCLEFGDRLQVFVMARRGFFRTLALLFILLFTTIWVPEYLLQPLWTDHEHVLVMARLWDVGQFPWTAMHTYQFPGEMELVWAFSQVAGWGNSIGFYAMDLLFSAFFCIILMKWSHRQLGHWAYALGGVISLILLQSSMPFSNVAQREAHATLCAMFAFIALGAFGNKKLGDTVSALFFAFGCAIRPHVVLFLPMLICGVWWSESVGTNLSGRSLKRVFRRVLRCAFLSIVFGLIFMEPILGPWRTPTFYKALQFPLQQAGQYAKGPFSHWRYAAWDYFLISRHFWFVGISLAMILMSRQRLWRDRGFVMLLVALTGGFYRMVHPVDHGYLRQPLQLLECLALPVFLAWVAAHLHYFRSWSWFAMFGLCLHVAEPEWPLYVDISYTPEAYRALFTGRSPKISPPGSIDAYAADESLYHYSWTNWNQMICWFRLETTRQTRILNLLSYHPFPPILATVDRLPIGRMESIVLMNWFTRYDFDSEIAESLVSAPAGSLVVWDAGRTNQDNIMRILKTAETIRMHYQKRMDFGEIEIWEKTPDY